MSSEKFFESCYSLSQWQLWVNAKCVELGLPSVYGYPSIREWAYAVGNQYGWVNLRNIALLNTCNIYRVYHDVYNFLVERSFLEIVNTCDYPEMLEVLR